MAELPPISAAVADPFIAFYPAGDFPDEGIAVDLRIRLAGGDFFYWYPDAKVDGEYLEFDKALLLEKAPRGLKLRPTNKISLGGEYTDHWYERARAGESLHVKTAGELEKFFYYGGCMAAYPGVSVREMDGRFYISNLVAHPVKDVVFISKRGDDIYYACVNSLAPGVTDLPVKTTKLTISPVEFAEEASSRWGLRLKKAGLFTHEVDALLRLMRADLFEKDGARAIYLAEGCCVNRLATVDIEPSPVRSVRVSVCSVPVVSAE